MKRSFQLWILSITLGLPFKPERALLLFLHKNHEPVLKCCFLLSCSSTKYDQTFSICSRLPNMSRQLPLLLPSLLHPPALCHVTSNCHRTNITFLFELVHILHKGSGSQIMLSDSWMQIDANMSESLSMSTTRGDSTWLVVCILVISLSSRKVTECKRNS